MNKMKKLIINLKLEGLKKEHQVKECLKLQQKLKVNYLHLMKVFYSFMIIICLIIFIYYCYDTNKVKNQILQQD